MERVTVNGSPEEIGLQHGKKLKEKIEASWDFYSQILFGNQMTLLEEYGNSYLEAIQGFAPEYGIEIRAVAKGAEMAPWQISALNARTEIFHIIMEKMAAGECTALYLPGSRILGQNWDWMEQLEPLFIVMQIERTDGHKILQVTEPGIIGKIGLNSKGLGTCLNIITGGASEVAIPIHILMRYILDADDLEHVLKRFQNTRQGTYSNILMADDQGRSFDMEFSGTEMEVVDFGDNIPMHTNHYLSRLKEGRDNSQDLIYNNSMTRYKRAEELLEGLDDSAGMSDIKTILMDTENESDAICSTYSSMLGLMIGTVSSIIMDLPNRELYVSSGDPSGNPYKQFGFQ